MIIYQQICRIAHDIIAEGFSEKVIHPGITTTEDVVWWYREKIKELKLDTWFQPSVSIQRNESEAIFSKRPQPYVILPGDLLHVDFGITYLRLNTDTQQHAYVLKPDETDAPDYLKMAFGRGNKLQDILTSNFKLGKTGNQVLADSRKQAISQGITPSIYTHPIGFHGHAAGTTIGMWDMQGGVPHTGDYPLHYNTAYSIELNASVYIQEWRKEIRIQLEEDGYFDETDFATSMAVSATYLLSQGQRGQPTVIFFIHSAMKIIRGLYTGYVIIVFSLLFLIFFILFLIPILFPKKFKLVGMINRWWAYVLFTLTAMPWSVEVLGKLNPKRSYIFCPNHFSYADIPVMGLNPHNSIFVGKNDMEHIPLFGFMYRKLHITVNRQDLKSRSGTFKKSLKAIDKGKSLVIYPEGGIVTLGEPAMGPFKDGAFRIAIEKQIPVVPVTLPNNWIILPPEEFLIRLKPIKIIIHEPIETTGMTAKM